MEGKGRGSTRKGRGRSRGEGGRGRRTRRVAGEKTRRAMPVHRPLSYHKAVVWCE